MDSAKWYTRSMQIPNLIFFSQKVYGILRKLLKQPPTAIWCPAKLRLSYLLASGDIEYTLTTYQRRPKGWAVCEG